MVLRAKKIAWKLYGMKLNEAVPLLFSEVSTTVFVSAQLLQRNERSQVSELRTISLEVVLRLKIVNIIRRPSASCKIIS